MMNQEVSVVVRVCIKRGNGMNDRVDKSRGIVTLMTESSARARRASE